MSAWSTSGDVGPLETRWNECASKMIAAGNPPINPMTEESVFRMTQWLKNQQPHTGWQPPSPAQKLADQELGQALLLYDSIVQKIADQQRQLSLPHLKSRCASLGLLIDESMARKPPSGDQLCMALFGAREFDSVDGARTATRKILGQVDALRDRLASIETVTWLADNPPDMQRLIWTVASRVACLEDRIAALEEQGLKQQTKPRRMRHA